MPLNQSGKIVREVSSTMRHGDPMIEAVFSSIYQGNEKLVRGLAQFRADNQNQALKLTGIGTSGETYIPQELEIFHQPGGGGGEYTPPTVSEFLPVIGGHILKADQQAYRGAQIVFKGETFFDESGQLLTQRTNGKPTSGQTQDALWSGKPEGNKVQYSSLAPVITQGSILWTRDPSGLPGNLRELNQITNTNNKTSSVEFQNVRGVIDNAGQFQPFEPVSSEMQASTPWNVRYQDISGDFNLRVNNAFTSLPSSLDSQKINPTMVLRFEGVTNYERKLMKDTDTGRYYLSAQGIKLNKAYVLDTVTGGNVIANLELVGDQFRAKDPVTLSIPDPTSLPGITPTGANKDKTPDPRVPENAPHSGSRIFALEGRDGFLLITTDKTKLEKFKFKEEPNLALDFWPGLANNAYVLNNEGTKVWTGTPVQIGGLYWDGAPGFEVVRDPESGRLNLNDDLKQKGLIPLLNAKGNPREIYTGWIPKKDTMQSTTFSAAVRVNNELVNMGAEVGMRINGEHWLVGKVGGDWREAAKYIARRKNNQVDSIGSRNPVVKLTELTPAEYGLDNPLIHTTNLAVDLGDIKKDQSGNSVFEPFIDEAGQPLQLTQSYIKENFPAMLFLGTSTGTVRFNLNQEIETPNNINPVQPESFFFADLNTANNGQEVTLSAKQPNHWLEFGFNYDATTGKAIVSPTWQTAGALLAIASGKTIDYMGQTYRAQGPESINGQIDFVKATQPYIAGNKFTQWKDATQSLGGWIPLTRQDRIFQNIRINKDVIQGLTEKDE
jgi:hypothetical protein